MTRLLVTGGGGFVGTEVVRRARAAGWPLVVSGRSVTTQVEAGVERVQVGELGPDTDWREALQDVGTVVHLAARAHVLRDRAADPGAAFHRANVAGSLALARQAFDAGVQRFVFVSSAGVAGATSGDRPIRDGDTPRPHSPYARSKLEAEQALFELGARMGRSVVCIRPPLVYGPGAPGNLRRLLRLLAAGWPLPFGAVRNLRSLVGVGNLADLLLTVARSQSGDGRSFYVTDGDISTPDLIRTLATGLGSAPRLIAVPVPWLSLGARVLGRGAMFDQLCASLQFDASGARSVFAWQPVMSQREGLLEMAQAGRSLRT